MATGSNIRVGDAERDATATQLREHYATGRLTLDELNERLDQTFRARTGADLRAVTRDLPAAAASGGFGHGDQSHRAGQLLGGSQSQWGPRAPGSQYHSGGQGAPGDGSGPRRRGLSAFAAVIPILLGVWALLVLGGLFAFGFGGGRPLAIVFALAALALIRRLFGGRRGYGRRYGRCGRRW